MCRAIAKSPLCSKTAHSSPHTAQYCNTYLTTDMLAYGFLSTCLLGLWLTLPASCLYWGKPGTEGGISETSKPLKPSEQTADPLGGYREGWEDSEDAGACVASLRAGSFEGSDRRNQAAYSDQTTWIKEFCRTAGNEFFAEVNKPSKHELTILYYSMLFKLVLL